MKAVLIAIMLALLAGCGSIRTEGQENHEAVVTALQARKSDLVLSMLAGQSSPEAERLRATAWLQKQNMAEARHALERAVQAGGSGAVHADFARLELIEGHVEEAAVRIEQARRIAPDELLILLTGAEIDSARGHLSVALAGYERASRLYPGNDAVQIGLVQVLARQGRWQDVERLIAPLLQRYPDDAELRALKISAERFMRVNRPAG